MTNQERVHRLREMVELLARVIEDAGEFARGQFSSTIGRDSLLREIDGCRKYMDANFTPDLINPEEK